MAKVSSGDAATLTITPDQSVYQVGDLITLNVFGDPEGESSGLFSGRILFDGPAEFVSSEQQRVANFFPNALFGGEGFADAFSQFFGIDPIPVYEPIIASVTLRATAPGTVSYYWEIEGDFRLAFFSLTDAPGGSVTIVPEPSTAAL